MKLSIWVSVITSGGANRMTSGAAALTRNPALRAAASVSLARGAASTMPQSNPRPRMWSISGWPSDSMPWRNDLPNNSARRTRSSAASTRSTASAAAVQTGCQQFGGRSDGQTRPDRQSAAQTLGQCHHVGGDAVVLVREKGAGAAHCRLHFVEHQQGAVPRRDIAGGGKVALGWDDDTALPHDRFQEYRGGVVADRGSQRVDVAVGHVRDVARQRLKWRLLGRLTGQRQRAHRPAVETFLCGDKFRAAGEPGQLERQLVGLGAGVAEKHSGLGVGTQQGDQFFGQRDPGFGGIQIGRVAQRRHLVRDGLDDGRVAMAEYVDRDAAEQVQVALAVHVGDRGTVTAGQSHRRGGVVIHHHGFPPLPHHLRMGHADTTLVPVPSSVNSSTSTQCLTLPSMTCALGTPPATALRQASILGIIPASSVGSSCTSVAVSISLTNESRSGQLVYRPSTSVSINSFSAPRASANAAAAVSALMLCTTPSASGASVATTGIRCAAIRSSTAAVLTWSTSPTRPMSVATPSTVTLRRTAVNSCASSPVMPTA